MWKVTFLHRAMIEPGDTVTCWSCVTGKRVVEGLGRVELETGMRHRGEQEGEQHQQAGAGGPEEGGHGMLSLASASRT